MKTLGEIFQRYILGRIPQNAPPAEISHLKELVQNARKEIDKYTISIGLLKEEIIQEKTRNELLQRRQTELLEKILQQNSRLVDNKINPLTFQRIKHGIYISPQGIISGATPQTIHDFQTDPRGNLLTDFLSNLDDREVILQRTNYTFQTLDLIVNKRSLQLSHAEYNHYLEGENSYGGLITYKTVSPPKKDSKLLLKIQMVLKRAGTQIQSPKEILKTQ